MSFVEDEGYYYEGDEHSLRGEIISILSVEQETDKAWLIKLKEGNKISEHWFPKSKCDLSSDKKSIEVPSWLLNKKGII